MKDVLKEIGISVAVSVVGFLICAEAVFGWVENLLGYWGVI